MPRTVWILWVDKLDGDAYSTLPALKDAVVTALKNGARRIVIKKESKM